MQFKKLFLVVDSAIQTYLIGLIMFTIVSAWLETADSKINLAGALLPVGFYQFAISNSLHLIIFGKMSYMRVVYILLSIITLILIATPVLIVTFYGWGQILALFSALLSFQATYKHFKHAPVDLRKLE